MNIKRTLISTAIISSLGLPAVALSDTVDFSFSGAWTFINSTGASVIQNTDGPFGAPWYSLRTPISGTLAFDTGSGAGSMTVAPFSFGGGGFLATKNVSLVRIGDGAGGPGNLILGNMGFNWNGNTGVPVSIVWDATGLLGALDTGLSTSDIVNGGALPATDAHVFDSVSIGTYTLPIGPAPLATTTFNTTTIAGAATLGANPSGTLPLTDDGIGGVPMITGPFPGFNMNYDITTLHVMSVTASAVPVPAAVWLFGSGLVGLIGVARRRQRH